MEASIGKRNNRPATIFFGGAKQQRYHSTPFASVAAWQRAQCAYTLYEVDGNLCAAIHINNIAAQSCARGAPPKMSWRKHRRRALPERKSESSIWTPACLTGLTEAHGDKPLSVSGKQICPGTAYLSVYTRSICERRNSGGR